MRGGWTGTPCLFFTNQNPMSNVPCAVERQRGPIFIFKIQNMYVAFPEGVKLYGNTPQLTRVPPVAYRLKPQSTLWVAISIRIFRLATRSRA